MASIDFYYDVVSPYSFIAFELVLRLAADHKASVKLNLKPFLLGGVMQAASNHPPAQIPAKAKYMPNDLTLLFEYYGLGTFSFPNKFPSGTLKAQRALIAIQMYYPEKLVPTTRKFWNFYWQEKKDIEGEDDVAVVLKAVGFSAAESARVLGALNDQAVKDKLRANTEEAVAKGAFGAPYIVARRSNGEERAFFGQDRIQPMLFFLGLVPRARY